MMQMLARGGLPPMTDGLRAADESNPEGYFEWEEIKNLPRDPALIGRAAGHAVKVVSPLLSHLPAQYRYKVIFMLRPPAEIARSQATMRSLLEASEVPSPETMQPLLAQHSDSILATLRGAGNIELLTVDYPALVADPAALSRRIAGFLGADLLPSAEAMAGAVQPKLHRQRADQP
jgi:hypothetical protein